MPSSTFNSDYSRDRVPPTRWSIVWGLSILLAIGILGGSEAFWRSRGHQPWISDTEALWAYHRRNVRDEDEKQVVLLGASLMQLGFSTDVFRERFPDYSVTQLAVNGGESAIPVLRDLASDEGFRGIVLCSLREEWFPREMWQDQQGLVEYSHRSSTPTSDVDTWLGLCLRSRLVITNPHLRLDNLARTTLRTGSLPAPVHLQMRTDRSILADYAKTDLDERAWSTFLKESKHWPAANVSASQALSDMEEAEEYVHRIQSRGGRVVFLRMPVSEGVWKQEQQRYPREEYWDAMAASSTAETIHFQDVPALTNLKFYDVTHLGCRESRIFTAALLDELVRRGVLFSCDEPSQATAERR